MMAFQANLHTSRVVQVIWKFLGDPSDLEQSLLKHRVFGLKPFGWLDLPSRVWVVGLMVEYLRPVVRAVDFV